MITGVICFGDSILAGTGALSRENGCVKRLKKSLKVPVSIKGINRHTSQDGLMRLMQDVIEQKHLSHVVILFGNNDCRLTESGQSVISSAHFLANLQEMANRIRQNEQTPLFCNLQPIDSRKLFKFAPEFEKHGVDPESLQKKYSVLVEEFARRSGHGIIDIRTLLESRKAEVIAEDGLHPNDFGHELIAKQILQTLQMVDPSLETIEVV